MSSQHIDLITRFKKGTYPRLYLLIVLLMLVVIVVRYHFLIGFEVEEARQRAATEINRMGHFLVPELSKIHSDPSAIQKRLDEEIKFTPILETLAWQEGALALALAAHSAAPPTPRVPAWFVQWVKIDRLEKQIDVLLPNGQHGTFRAVVWPNASVDEVWEIVRPQLMLTFLNVVTIFAALTFLLRANARMLDRLSVATKGFQSGHLDTRMGVKGTLEMRAVADTFNAMAMQIEQLVKSLQQSESEQADQLHFTRQLVDSLPLPVFVRSARDVCLVVNPAWERMFGVSSAAVVGTPMPSYFNELEEDIIDISDADDSGFLKTTSQAVYSIHANGETRYVLYFRAPFTNRSGILLGTIAALVDVTDRERSNHTLS